MSSGNFKSLIRQSWFTATLTLVLVMLSGVFMNVAAQQRTTLGPAKTFAPQAGNDAAAAMFRAGRDLITEQQWAKAQAKFDELISAYPNDKNIDAALYWKAYAQNKQSQIQQCRETLNHLLEKYPNTAWREDARLLLAQTLSAGAVIAADAIRTVPYVSAGDADAYILSATAPVAIGVGKGLGRGVSGDDWVVEGGANAADDDPCEFKIVVLQALFQTDVQRGIVVATDWLKPGSTQTVRCKGAALTLLGRNGGKAVTPIILGVAKSEQDLKLRARAISALGATNDDSVIDALRDFALNSSENDIVEASLYALSRHTGDRAIAVLSEIAASSNKPTSIRRLAISNIASRPGESAVDALLKIYDSATLIEIRKSAIAGLGNRRSERAGTKLLEIARGSDAIELRKAAISAMSRRGGDKVIDNLLNLYDSEKNEELKDQIINSLGMGSVFYRADSKLGRTVVATGVGSNNQSRMNDQRVIHKLIEIARDPQTPMERRKRAIGWLSRSNDPEVLKFLEDLLK